MGCLRSRSVLGLHVRLWYFLKDGRSWPLLPLEELFGRLKLLLAAGVSLEFGTQHCKSFARIRWTIHHHITVLTFFQKLVTHEGDFALVEHLRLLRLFVKDICEFKELPSIVIMGASIERNDILLKLIGSVFSYNGYNFLRIGLRLEKRPHSG